MDTCELCAEYGDHDCKQCNLGNPCIGCADYDMWNDTCISKGACGGKMKIHQLKILDCFANEIISGNKMFELRKNDRGYQKGDYICFTVLSDESGKEIKHAINTRLYEITCVLSGWGLMDGYVALGIREADGIEREM